MRSIIAAMLWEYTRRARSTFVSILAAVLVLPTVTYGARTVAGPFDDPLIAWLEFVFIVFCLVGYNLAVLSMQGALPGVRLGAGPERFYTLPLPTWWLAVGQLASGMTMIALLYLATAAVVNVVFGVGWPLAGPALLAAMSYACLQAAVWGTLRLGLGQLLAGAAVAIPLYFWLQSHYGPRPGAIEHTFSPLGLWEAAAMFVVIALSIAIGSVAVARDRRGDMQGWIAARRWIRSTIERLPGRQAPFRSAGHAQVWFEWRQKGWLIPAAYLAILLVIGSIQLIASRSIVGALQEIHGGGIGALIVASFVAALGMGHLDLPRGRMEFSPFLGTRPLTDAALAAATLKTSLAGLTIVWGMWLACLAGGSGILWLTNGSAWYEVWRDAVAEWPRQLPILFALLLLSWAVPATLIPVGLTGRSRLLLGLLCGLPTVLLLWMIIVQHWLPEHIATVVRSGTAYGLAAIMASGVILAFVLAARRGKSLVSPALALVSWLVLSGIGAGSFWVLEQIPWPLVALMAGLSALAISPLATAPLAISWNRHR